ncbi:hypothetical protein VE04_01600 [Pseudogymnoascus sp. 24MN13]|nr:hypothetical protein VE04_01600 [Pseudogymnoascus sp. 24MN13]
MEDPLTMFDNNFHISDSEMPYFSYPDACVDYQVTDFRNLSCLFDPQISYQTEPNVHLDNALTRVSHGNRSSISSISSISSNESPELHEDLSNFFSQDLLSSPATGQPFATLDAQIPHSGYSSMPLDSHLAITAPNSWASPPPTSPSTCPAIFTSGFEPFKHHTVMNHGQVTPGNSPKDLQPLLRESTKAAPMTRRQSRNGKEVAAVTTTTNNATAAVSVESEKNTKPLKDGRAKVKKPTKSQQPSKKTTLENVAAKREAFLKRNKEAASKCRMKMRTQRVEDAVRMTVLTEDNASKGLEVEKLRSEVYGLKKLLLSHYRECGEERLMDYWNGFRGVGAEEGVGAGRHGDGNVVGSVEGSFEDGGVNIYEGEGREEPRQRHRDDMEDISVCSFDSGVH